MRTFPFSNTVTIPYVPGLSIIGSEDTIGDEPKVVIDVSRFFPGMSTTLLKVTGEVKMASPLAVNPTSKTVEQNAGSGTSCGPVASQQPLP
jgi:hypothetical protein